VEDNEADAELLLMELDAGGFDVDWKRVETANAMRRELRDRSWDLVVSDYSMPSFDAIGALAVLKESNQDLPFIVVSGTIGEDNAVEALKRGANDFLIKGKLARLLPAVDRELREAEVRRGKRRAEEELRESEQRYRRIVETTNEGVCIVDVHSVIRFANHRMAGLLGYGVDELLGKSIFDFVESASRSTLEKGLDKGEGALPGEIEIRFKRKDGTDLWMLVDSAPILDAAGRREGALAMSLDITSRKRLEDQLRQSQKMEAIGSLAGGVAHDFNNLLSVILSYTTLLLEGLKPGDPIAGELQEVRGAGERAAALTRQLLAFSRRQVLELRVLDLNQVLGGMEKMLKRLLAEDVELSLLTFHGLGKVRADAGQIEQIVMNLVVNARDAMPQGGKISIETGNAELDAAYAALHLGVKPGPYVVLAVTDSGMGMDAATQARIFEPFFTTKEVGKGTGLGLSTVFGIVQQSGGHIWVYSEPGKGTTFKIYLPRIDGEADTVRASSPPATLRGTETILLVEDEEAVRGVARSMLRRQGYNVLDAQNGGEAFLVSEKYAATIHLLITDVVMPRMSGRELAERLAPVRPEMKVLYLSGYTDKAIVHHGVLESGIAFLQKPITPDVFLRKVREVLDVSVRRRERR
jgi:PAS domain S-box-containing protein